MDNEQHIDSLFACSMQELKRGYGWNEESGRYICLACGYKTEQGNIYPAADGTGYRDAEKQMKEHIAEEHGSMFHYLLTLDKKRTGLSELQRQLLLLFYEGVSDSEVVKRTGAGSASTIRNHRFVLREKEKQARLFLTLMELLQENTGVETDRAPKNKTAKVSDPASSVSDDFPEGLDGPLRMWPNKESRRKAIAGLLQRRFQHGRTYTEQEVNSILEQAWPDYAVLRRYMIEYDYLLRKDDGSAYWLPEDDHEDAPDTNDNRRKELVSAYQEKEHPAGVFLIRNKRNDKIGIGSNPNLEGAVNRIKFELSIGHHRDPALQQDWNEDGEAGFEFEVLEKLSRRKDGFQDVRKELAGMEAAWLEKLRPYGERGYNGSPEDKKKI